MKYIRWFLINGIFAFFLIAGTFYAQEWAMNITTFFVVALTLLSIFLFFISFIGYVIEKTDGLLGAAKKQTPVWLEVVYDIPYMAILAAFGEFWLAGLWFIQFLCVVLTKGILKDVLKKSKKG